jgi:hypothetical protein
MIDFVVFIGILFARSFLSSIFGRLNVLFGVVTKLSEIIINQQHRVLRHQIVALLTDHNLQMISIHFTVITTYNFQHLNCKHFHCSFHINDI